MKKTLFASPDSFSVAPLLALLPVRGSALELEKLTASLFARYEKVRASKKAMGASSDRELLRRAAAEEAMLKHVLEWLSVSTGEESDV